ncbi:uncharacterized protein ric3a [Garra rufa]|uniref:uncharacterized protein ric3a n=1 Tax=Garra rufa TaxID=137080 RepID=UPI003CCEF33A
MLTLIFQQLTSKDKPHRPGCRFPILQSEYTFEEMPTCQLVQMQARMSEKAREKKISKVVHPSTWSRRSTRKREERKLKQLKEISQIMRERQLREGATPEEEAEEAPYTADWEGYPEETYPEFKMSSRRRRFPSVILEEPDQVIPTAEELAERMEKEEEEEDEPDDACTNEEVKVENNEGEKEEDDEEEDEEDEDEEEEDEDDIGEDQPCLPKSIDEDDEKLEYLDEKEEEQKPTRRRQITFSDHRHVFHYPKGGAVGCKYEEEEEEEHDGEEEEQEEEDDDEGNEEEENGEDCEEEEEEEEEDQRNEDGQGETETEKEEEDPLMEAESLGFNDDVECDPEEQEVDLIDFLQTYQPEVTVISNKSELSKAQASGTLRMRHKKQKVKK